MKKYLIPALVLTTAQAALASPTQIGGFDLKRYSDEKMVSKILSAEMNDLDESTCVGDVLDSREHQAMLAAGRYIQGITLKTTIEDDEPLLVASLEYASVRPKVPVIKKILKCLLLDDSGQGVTISNDFSRF